MYNKPSRTTFRNRLETMVSTLRHDIENGKLQDGQFLPSISQLSKQYMLSVNSVQKGLDQLVKESLIEKIPRVGIRVRQTTAQDTVSITIGHYPSLQMEMELDEIILNFQEEFPNIQVQTLPLHFSNYYDAAKYYLDNGIVDAITINHLHFMDFEGRHDDLTEMFKPIEAAPGMFPFLQDQFIHKGEQLAQTLIFSPVILCCNTQHLAERNMPEPCHDWTWRQFMSYLEQFESSKDSRMGFYFYPPNYNRWPIFLLQSGEKSQGNANTDIDMTSSPLIEGVQACYELMHRQKMRTILLSDNDINVEGLFAEQKISIMMTTYFNMNKLRNEVDFPFEIAPLPYVHTPKTLLLTVGMAINQKSKQKAAAQAFIEYAASFKSQLHIRKHTYSIPALQEAAEWEGEEVGYRPNNFNLYSEISPTYAQLSDLRLSIQECEALLNVMNMYWMDLATKEETVIQLSKIIKPSEL